MSKQQEKKPKEPELQCPRCKSTKLSNFYNWEGECESWECKDCRRIWDESDFLYPNIDEYV